MNIITPRLIIRELRLEDAEDYHSIFGDSEIAKYDDYELTTLEEAKDTIREYIGIYDKNPTEIEYGVELKERAEVIGIINLNREAGKLYIGFHFKQSFHGKGYAFEAMEAVIHHLNVQVFAKVDPENARSIALLTKLGFHFVKAGKMASGKQENIFSYTRK
jgi:[ribosomal protein S5]-alanine N-acetyltransferase